jgi:hypothetical protein
MEDAMRRLTSILFLAATAPLALAACSSTPDTSTVATVQEPLRTDQQAKADARALNQQISQAYPGSVTE